MIISFIKNSKEISLRSNLIKDEYDNEYDMLDDNKNQINNNRLIYNDIY